MPQEMWAGLLTLGDIQSYDSLVCHHLADRVKGQVLIDVDFLYACLNYSGSLCCRVNTELLNKGLAQPVQMIWKIVPATFW